MSSPHALLYLVLTIYSIVQGVALFSMYVLLYLVLIIYSIIQV